jgi:hypothetical protein
MVGCKYNPGANEFAFWNTLLGGELETHLWFLVSLSLNNLTTYS